MDSRFPGVSKEDLYSLQMELKQVQAHQNNHAERLLRLEKRQADDAVLKSVWNSPFPSVLGGTPQQGPVQIPPHEIFDDLDEQGEQLLGSLHLGPAEEEPVRRGAASRANSVRFDESALQSSSWGGGHASRHSGDFGPIRPGSAFMMERTLSHKSDGRHSSAGHSVHSHHSVASGRASSIGMDTNYPGDEDDDDDSFEIPGPPVSFFVLGSVPSIVRCWLTTNYAHGTLLYADVCTGAQRSTVEFSLIRELDLTEEIQRDADGAQRISLSVYLAEAIVTQHSSRSSSSEGAVPSMTVLFEITGAEQPFVVSNGDRKPIRIFIGSDALRAHSADVLFSSNTMILQGDDRERLRVPFVRPEDDAVFKHISTGQALPERPKLNANAAPFVFGEPAESRVGESAVEDDEDGQEMEEEAKEEEADQKVESGEGDVGDRESLVSPREKLAEPARTSHSATASENGIKGENSSKDDTESERGTDKGGSTTSEARRRESSTGIWGSWRNGPNGGPDRESGPISGYQPAARSSRGMKILKPQKTSASASSPSARTGPSYEPAPPLRSGGEGRRKSQMGMGLGPDKDNLATGGSHNNSRWDSKRAVSAGGELKVQVPATNTGLGTSQPSPKEGRSGVGGGNGNLPRSANPVGGASAFSWMTPPPARTPRTVAD